MILTILAFLISLGLAYAFVPLFASLAERVGLVDHPDNNRKLHQNSIPMVGGLTLFFAAPITAVPGALRGSEFRGNDRRLDSHNFPMDPAGPNSR